MSKVDGISKALYRFRGYILGLLALTLLLLPPTPPSLPACIAALLFVSAGALLRIRTRQYIGNHTRGSRHEAQNLVTSGPYAYTRHPLYLSNTIVALGFILFHAGLTPCTMAYACAVVAFEITLARIEDRFLEDKFGDQWRSWAKGNKPKSVQKPERSFLKAFCADASTWMWLIFYNLILVLVKFY